MSTLEGQEQKYAYKFRLEARKEQNLDEPSKAEVQAYVNEVLGVKPKSK